MVRRVVFDTNVALSTLVFTNGRLAWLRGHWMSGGCEPLISDLTIEELVRILNYPKFKLSPEACHELLADYLPYCETVDVVENCTVVCRDSTDQKFLDLAESGGAEILVSGDADLLALAGQTKFLIETPEAYRDRISVG